MSPSDDRYPRCAQVSSLTVIDQEHEEKREERDEHRVEITNGCCRREEQSMLIKRLKEEKKEKISRSGSNVGDKFGDVPYLILSTDERNA